MFYTAQEIANIDRQKQLVIENYGYLNTADFVARLFGEGVKMQKHVFEFDTSDSSIIVQELFVYPGYAWAYRSGYKGNYYYSTSVSGLPTDSLDVVPVKHRSLIS